MGLPLRGRGSRSGRFGIADFGQRRRAVLTRCLRRYRGAAAGNRLLPATLDANGLILPRVERKGSPEIATAAELALALFEALPAGDPRIPAARQFLAEVSNRAALLLSRVPSDLFFPTTGSTREERPMEARGETARVAIETEAVADPDTGLLDQFERRIITQIGPDTRLSRDSWTLEPQVPAP